MAFESKNKFLNPNCTWAVLPTKSPLVFRAKKVHQTDRIKATQNQVCSCLHKLIKKTIHPRITKIQQDRLGTFLLEFLLKMIKDLNHYFVLKLQSKSKNQELASLEQTIFRHVVTLLIDFEL